MESGIQFELSLMRYNGLRIHASAVEVDGKAYLFSANSGTGKSTHTRLWREVFGDRAVMVNDDKPFLRMTEGAVMVYGSPWNGKHGLGCNLSVPLKAVCILERGEENRIEKISAKQAFVKPLC
jgi:serine kinase of HPr protein (carbohydrate metabolism regulator)